MKNYVIRRLLSVIPVLWLVSILVFGLIHLVPGDPVLVILGSTAEKDQVERLELIARNLKPIVRYASGNGAEIPAEECTLSYEELKYLGF